ncbi:MAG: 50S ribosomal protein L30 [Halobacteriota archaeon]
MQAIVQLRGPVNTTRSVLDTLDMLNLGRVNHCTFVPEEPSYRGMITKVMDQVAVGEPSPEVVATLLARRGEPVDGSQGIDDDWVRDNTDFGDLDELAVALCDEEVTLTDVGLEPVLRLHPPRGGHDGIKHHRADGGQLGKHSTEAIDALLYRMR